MIENAATGPHGPLANVLAVRGGKSGGRAGLVHREALIYTLGKAAELEHLIMLQYLFAAFSLKQHVSEGLSEEALDAVRRWRATLLSIGEQEMLHLALVQNLQEFDTIGQLYRSIQAGLEHLADRLGPERLFIGPVDAQATEEHFRWEELVAVTDLASARRAIDTIVEQGEGASGEWREA